jgi:DNA-binding XRE family transcriptional regulator
VNSRNQPPLLGDEASLLGLSPLVIGSSVRLTASSDPWLKQYRGTRGRVERDDGLTVEVRLPGGELISLWRNEVKPVSALPHGQRSHHERLAGQAVPGIALLAERRRAGLTQLDIATVMGVSVPRISQIEAAAAIRAVTACRYLEALCTVGASAA